MGISLATVAQVVAITSATVHLGITVYNFIEEKTKKRKDRSKQNKEDKDQYKFQRDHRQEREIMNYYQRGNQKYNKMYDRWRDYDDDNFDYY